MKKIILSAILLVVVLSVGVFFLTDKPSISKASHESFSSTHRVVNKKTELQSANSVQERKPSSANRQLASPPRALEALGQMLSQADRGTLKLNDLLQELVRTGQEPLVARDSNPDTGEMLVVRTKSPLPGTRYFHAQYFTDENGERFVQHMSFEYKPSPTAMAEAVAMVERNFSDLSRPIVQREDYVKWKKGHDYVVWVKKMNPSDLRDDPFNAYTISDNGTIRVAVELEIHD